MFWFLLLIFPSSVFSDGELAFWEKLVFLNYHNKIRNKTAQGEQKCSDGVTYNSTYCPQATNMNFLMWDPALALLGQNYSYQMAQNCDLTHNTNRNNEICNFEEFISFPHDCNSDDQMTIGENIAYSSKPKAWTNALEVINGFYDNEYYLYVYNDEKQSEAGHFQQMIWADTRYIGCGCARGGDECTGRRYCACQYYPVGYLNNEYPYESGTTCSNCDSDITGSVCNDGLCYGCYYNEQGCTDGLDNVIRTGAPSYITTAPFPTVKPTDEPIVNILYLYAENYGAGGLNGVYEEIKNSNFTYSLFKKGAYYFWYNTNHNYWVLSNKFPPSEDESSTGNWGAVTYCTDTTTNGDITQCQGSDWLTSNGGGEICFNNYCSMLTPAPTNYPSFKKSQTDDPTTNPSDDPSMKPSNNPSKYPTNDPTGYPTTKPSNNPSLNPTNKPTGHPAIEGEPTHSPITLDPSKYPTNQPSDDWSSSKTYNNFFQVSFQTVRILKYLNNHQTELINAIVNSLTDKTSYSYPNDFRCVINSIDYNTRRRNLLQTDYQVTAEIYSTNNDTLNDLYDTGSTSDFEEALANELAQQLEDSSVTVLSITVVISTSNPSISPTVSIEPSITPTTNCDDEYEACRDACKRSKCRAKCRTTYTELGCLSSAFTFGDNNSSSSNTLAIILSVVSVVIVLTLVIFGLWYYFYYIKNADKNKTNKDNLEKSFNEGETTEGNTTNEVELR